jgi:hypothetical protein
LRRLATWRTGIAALLAAGVLVPTVLLLRAMPAGKRSFDTDSNGLWIGHRWYTGREVKTGERVPFRDVGLLVARLRASGIRDVYVHTGPIQPDGTTRDSADPLFAALTDAYPEGRFFAWLGARLATVPLDRREWRAAVVAQIEKLRSEGFDGVHFDLEPLRDGHPGYLELLSEARDALGPDWLISQATPRASPFGFSLGPLHRNLWSSAFYRATMEFADQTVLMAYETGVPFRLGYIAHVREQTQRLIEWACRARRHEILIGIPSYHDGPAYTDPVENIADAALGVRSALESFDTAPACFRGVSIYANWVTDAAEWSQLDRFWRRPDDS